MIVEGFDLARAEVLKFLDEFKECTDSIDRELLISMARTSLKTKLPVVMAEKMAEICCDAVLCLKREDKPEEAIDLQMIEIMAMKHKLANETRLVKGLVLDHGSRHPDMPKELKNCYILTANVSLEYEKTEVNSGFYYSSAEQRDKLVASERYYTDEKSQASYRTEAQGMHRREW